MERIKPNNKKEDSFLPDVKISSDELKKARTLGIRLPEAGLPDLDAIEKNLDFTPEDLKLFNPISKLYKGKINKSTSNKEI